MKHSIKIIFRNLSIFLALTSIMATIALLLIVEQNNSFHKVDNLNNQKVIISTLIKLDTKDLDLALIQYNGKSNQLKLEINKLRDLYTYDYIGKYILKNSDEYLADLDKLSELTNKFNDAALKYYTQENIKNKRLKTNLDNSFNELYAQINNIIFKNLLYNKEKFHLFKTIAIMILVVIFATTIWYRRRLNAIYQDILFLYSVEKNRGEYTIFSSEVDAIALRMKRKSTSTDNQAMIDPVTGINNNRGLINSYAEKKGMKESNFTSLTILEIDNFSKSNRAFSQELTQLILKKVAFTISLHEQSTDVIARTDYNQFTIILSRPSKEQSYKDIEIIRQSISEIKFQTHDRKPIQVTVSGGYVIKPNNMHLDETISQAKKVLDYAKNNGRNKIAQIRDLAEQEL